MAKYILTALDVTGIQRYIFNSNRLKENVGASELVHRATTRFVFETLPQYPACNVVNIETGELNPAITIQQADTQAEVVYAAGGNALILFKDKQTARDLVTRLSQKLIVDAPGLDLVAAHHEFEWGDENANTIGPARRQVLEQLQQVKNRRVVSQPVLGLGVTVACQSTGLPAVAIHPDKEDENYPVSAEVWAKVKNAENATDRFKEHVKQNPVWQKILNKPYYFPMEFDDFGRSEGENSYIAVVHADVNGMGQRVERIITDCQAKELGNRATIQEIRNFSNRVSAAARAGLVQMVANLAYSVDGDNEVSGKVPLTPHKKGYFLPFRPLVFGGDDLTFVCDGRLGLSLTETYLNAFESAINDPTISVSAGVSVVKTHYPFARAYQIAEDLCGKAKKHVERQAYALDWHFAASGLLGKLKIIREKQYTVKAGKLRMRPVRLASANGDWRTWQNVRETINIFNDPQGPWYQQHNKAMKLRQALRDGPVGVRRFLTAYEETRLPKMVSPAVPGIEKTGWEGDICGYFDSIEAMDFYVPLQSAKGTP